MVVVQGKGQSPTICVTAGVHPTEYAGVEAALRVAQTLEHMKLKGRVVILPFVNLLGFNSRNIGVCPEDSVDIFRAFPGRSVGTVSYAIASQVFQGVVRSSDCVVDLHGGEMNESEAITLAWYCRTGSRNVDAASAKLARAFGAAHVLDATDVWIGKERWSGPEGTLLYEASRMGVPTIMGEAGGEGRVSEDSARAIHDGVVRVCKALGALPGRPSPRAYETLHRLTLLTTRHEGLLRTFVEPGQLVRKGQRVAEVRDWEGNVKDVVSAPFAGMVTIKVNWLPVRAGEWLVAMAMLGHRH